MITTDQLKEVLDREESLRGYLDIDAKIIQLEEEELRTQVPGFWDDNKAAEAQMKIIRGLKGWIEGYNTVKNATEELQLAFDFQKEGITSEEEVDTAYAHALAVIEDLELRNMLRREEDKLGAVLKINSGAGGTEGQDWASMLFRMYQRWCEKNNYEKPICIYLKTGNESQNSLTNIEKQGFSIFGRLDFINLLDEFKDINNDIFTDFYERLKRIEKSNNEFENKLIKDWSGHDWQGFFQFLEKEVEIVNWNYVNNPSGGFWNAVLNWDYWNIYPVYIQLEEGKLCFKISTDPDELEMPENLTRSEIRNQLHTLILKQAVNFGFEYIRRPDRFGNGNYMTVAIVDRENWLGADSQTIDKETIIKTLTAYLDFLRKIINVEQERGI